MSWSVQHSSCSPGRQNPAGCELRTICQRFQIGQATLSGCFVPMSRGSARFSPPGRTMFLQKTCCTAISPVSLPSAAPRAPCRGFWRACERARRARPTLRAQAVPVAKTVDTYRSRLMLKLGVPDLAALVRYAVREGMVETSVD